MKNILSNTIKGLIIFSVLLPWNQLLAQPTITSFEPTIGPIGTSVTITGTGFDMTPTNNVVFFGATQAVVSEANTTSLAVVVPIGASYQLITILVKGLVAYSSAPFIVTFDGGGTIDVGSFRAKVDFATGDTPWLIANGDLDGDGKPDLVVANSASNTVSVYRNTSPEAGVISYETPIDYETGVGPFSVSIGDLDGDAKPDLAVANTDDNTVSVYRNTSTGAGAISYAGRIDFTTGSFPISVSIGDLDADGKSDLAVANNRDASVSILKNTSTGAGVLSYDEKVDYTTGPGPISVAIGELNGDGKFDLAVANWEGTTVSILRNTSTAAGVISYAPRVDYAAGDGPRSVAIGDLDADGKSDLAVTNAYSGTASIFRNTSTGTEAISFETKVDYATGSGPVSVAIGDLDGDSKPDLAVSNDGSNFVSIFHNTSSGSGVINFAFKVDYPTGSHPWSVALVDSDGDGRSELMVANYAGNSISVLKNLIGSDQQVDLTSSNLPIILISTSGEDGITNEFKIDATMKVVYDSTGGRNLITGPFSDYDGKIGIKGRGSSSWLYYPKKGYTLETRTELDSNNNVSLLGMPKENDWVLHGPYGDKTLMKNAFVYTIGQELGRYSPKTRFCELVLNDVYAGVYLLTEKIKRDKNRVDIAKLKADEVTGDDLTGGYILSVDREKDEYWSPLIAFNDGASKYNYIYPDPKGDMPQVQKDYIREYVTNFEKALRNNSFQDTISGYRAYVNLPSFIDYFIMNEWTKNIDAYRLSSYFYKDKDSKGGKLTMGPLWDYNLSSGGINIGFGDWGGTAENWIHEENNGLPFWWSTLLNDPYYTACLKQRWTDLRQNVINEDNFGQIIDEFAALLDEAKDRNFQIYPLEEAVWGNDHEGFTYAQEVDTLKGYLKERMEWMDVKIASLPGDEECNECFTCEPEKNVVTALSSVLEEKRIMVYPNPFEDHISFHFISNDYSNIEIEIYDIMGKKVKSIMHNQVHENDNISVNMSSLNGSGFYFYVIRSNKEQIDAGKILRK